MLSLLSVSRLVKRLVGRVVGRCAVLVSSFSRAVSSLVVRPIGRLVGALRLGGPFAPVVPLVGPSWRFGFLASRRSSREASREAPRLVLP